MNRTLADDHSELDSMLEELFGALETSDAGRIYRQLDFFWARLAMHIRAEHLHLFPAILGALEKQTSKADDDRRPPLTKARNAIEVLRNDHNFFMRELSGAIKKLSDARENKAANLSKQIADVRETIVSVKRRLQTHNETEETEVYKWAERLLDSSERAALDERMRREITSLPPRFAN